MKNAQPMTVLLFLLLLPLLILSCEDKMEEHYNAPSWLKGSAWKVLEEKGNYSIFLKGIELAGYRPILEGKNILTVIAPDDVAFSAYLQGHNYTNIEEMPSDERNKLIGFHLLYYSYNKEQLINFRPEGDLITDDKKEINAGLYYKFRTRSNNIPTKEMDLSNGKLRTVYHLDRFVPIFSYCFFNTKKLNAETNYEYFYPNSTWNANEGFNVSNASVKEYGIIADNGYIYAVDQVVTPLETIYTELENNKDYSIFFDLYNKFSTYEYDEFLSKDYATSLGTDSLFIHRHGIDLPAIAMEWYSSDYTQIADNASKAYSVFAPDNTAIIKFFNDFWSLGEYDSIDDIDNKVIKYMILQYLYSESVAFPEEIQKGFLKNVYGMPFNFDLSAVKDKAMCVNGTFYGLNAIETPILFASVVGPAFRNKNCNYYLYMLDGSNLVTSYASQDAKYTLLLPTNEQIESTGIYLKSYTTGNVLQEETENGWTNISTTQMQEIVNIHTSTEGVEIKKTGTQVFTTQTGFNYWYVKNGGITNSASFNQILEPDNITNPFVTFTEVKNGREDWNNGKTYYYNNSELFTAESTDGLAHRLAVCNDQRYAYYAFAQLLQKANMITSTNNILGIMGSRFISFIPTNDAIKKALAEDKIPGIHAGSFDSNGNLNASSVDTNTLQSYLLSYFLLDRDNVITSYPYPKSNMKSDIYNTANIPKKIKYTDLGNSMRVQLDNGDTAHVISDFDYFPFAFNDGCFHLIDTVL